MRRGAVLLFLFVGCAVSRPVDAPDASVPLEDVDAGDCLAIPDIDFGEVPVGNRSVKHLTFRGAPDAPVLILVGAADAPFTVTPQGLLQVESGQSITVEIGFAPDDGSLHLGVIPLTVGTACAPQQVKLRGLGGGLVDFPELIEFVASPIGVPTTKPMRVTNTQRVDAHLTLTTTAFSPTSAFSVPFTVVVPARSVIDVPITVTPPDLDVVEGVLSVEGAGPRREVALRALGGFPAPHLSRVDVDLGQVALVGPTGPSFGGQTFVVLTNVGGGLLTFPSPAVEISVDGGSGLDELRVGVPADSLRHDDVRLVVVSVSPLSSGPRAWHVKLRTDPAISFDVRANVVTVPSCVITWAPTSLSLGTVPVGQRVSGSIAITNLASTPCLVDDIVINPFGEWQLLTPEEITVAPGATETIDVAITPMTVGRHLDTVFFRPFREGRPAEGVLLELEAQ
jgi:hypothetical protein